MKYFNVPNFYVLLLKWIYKNKQFKYFIGALESDYINNDVINCEPEQTEEVTEEDKQLPKDNKYDVEIGKIVFVSCAAGSEETNLEDTQKSDQTNSLEKVNDGESTFIFWL